MTLKIFEILYYILYFRKQKHLIKVHPVQHSTICVTVHMLKIAKAAAKRLLGWQIFTSNSLKVITGVPSACHLSCPEVFPPENSNY